MIDYTGKLNKHDVYLEILQKLKGKTEYIEIVILDEQETNSMVEAFYDDILERKKVSQWWGTVTEAVNNLFRIKASDRMFRYLAQFETFCKYYAFGTTLKSLRYGDYSEDTDFGIDDIAFYGRDGCCLLCTTTHEGYIMIDEKLLDD